MCEEKPVKGTTKKRTAAPKKVPKSKKFTYAFSPTEDNYVGLLNAFLKAHHLDTKYEATKRRVFSNKVHIPPAK